MPDSQWPAQGAPARFAPHPLHVLVTGGTGFVGGHLIGALQAEGHRVTVLTRQPRLPPRLADHGVRACRDLALLAPDDPVDAVVNLAGARILGVPWTAARRQVLLDSRIGLTRRLVDWIGTARTKPRVLVSGSAIGYYGVQQPGDDTAWTEAQGPQPRFMSELCRLWEEAAGAAAGHGTAVACLRFGLVLGPGGALPLMLLPVRLGLGGRLGSGRQWVSWVHIDDVVGAVAHVMRGAFGPGVAGSYNVTAPQAVRQIDFNRTAARVLRRPCVMPTPAWPVRLLLGEQAQLLVDGQRVVPQRLSDEGFVFRHPTLQGALAQLLQG